MKVDVQVSRRNQKQQFTDEVETTVENNCKHIFRFRAIACDAISSNCEQLPREREYSTTVPRVVQNKDRALLQAFEK